MNSKLQILTSPEIEPHHDPKRFGPMCNALSVDVEDYFQTEAMASIAHRKSWSTMPSRVERNTHLLLEVLQRHKVRATFFFLGWIADRFPHLVREVAALGHEIASHSYWHHPVFRLSPAAFKEDTFHSKGVIEDAAGAPVIGYRAPSFSILPSTEWAFDILAKLGFLYDSSMHPIQHDIYGNPDRPRSPFLTGNGSLLELPIATLRFWSRNFPIAGGGYFRALPYACTKRGIRHLNRREATSAIFYLHPWELDTEQPRLPAKLKSRIRQYLGLRTTVPKLNRLLQDFEFAPIREVYLERLPTSRTVKTSSILRPYTDSHEDEIEDEART